MEIESPGGGTGGGVMIGWSMKCHRCGDPLPLLHPHIVVERYDEQENLICEDCYQGLCGEKPKGALPSLRVGSSRD